MVAGGARDGAARAPGRALAGRPRRTASDVFCRDGRHRTDRGLLLLGFPPGAGRRLPGGGVFWASVFAPAVGSLLTELFPTSVRASVIGWWTVAGVLGAVVGLVAFGAVADVGNRFAAAADVVFLPCALAAGLFWALPGDQGSRARDVVARRRPEPQL